MRDTDRDWQILGEQNPFFGVLTNERYLGRDLDEATRDEFYESGVRDVDYIVRRIREKLAADFAPETALDFGCGVGRLTFAMTTHAKRVIGLDISDGMLQVAESERKRRGLASVQFTSAVPETGLDWVNSLIVFQHIDPSRGTGIIRDLAQRLNSGGILSIQVTYYRDNRHLGELVRDLQDFTYDGSSVRLLSTNSDVAAGAISMYDYDLNNVFRVLHSSGVSSIYTEPTDHAGCHGIRIFGIRD